MGGSLAGVVPRRRRSTSLEKFSVELPLPSPSPVGAGVEVEVLSLPLREGKGSQREGKAAKCQPEGRKRPLHKQCAGSMLSASAAVCRFSAESQVPGRWGNSLQVEAPRVRGSLFRRDQCKLLLLLSVLPRHGGRLPASPHKCPSQREERDRCPMPTGMEEKVCLSFLAFYVLEKCLLAFSGREER